jgi:hypothetical protein
MPDKNKQHKDPQVDRFLEENPTYKPFFETFPIPESSIEKSPYIHNYEDFLRRNETALQEKAKLNYMSSLLNKELEKKYPKEYQQITSQYGWNPDKPLSPETRVKGADAFAKKSPSFYLDPEEQKKVLGEGYSEYATLRGKYAKDLNLIGEGDDPNKPESWKVGARHAVAFNPISATLEVSPKENSQKNKNESKFSRYEQYSPEEGYTGYTKYSNINPDNPQENVKDVKTRRLEKVDFTHDNSDRVTTDQGIVFKEPGFHFYKHYDDGTKEEISKNDYQTMKMFNTLPAYLKNKYVEEVKPKENEEVASNVTYANK